MMLGSAAIGVLASWAGVVLSYAFDLPSGATIVLLLTFIFLLSVIFSPKNRQKKSTAVTAS
jgi:manganese/iron transport system permease protein